MDLVRGDEGSIQLMRPRSETTHCTLVRKGNHEERVLDSYLDDFLTGYVMQHKEILLNQDIVSLTGLSNLSNKFRTISSILAVPLTSAGNIYGAINLIRK